MKWKSSGGIGTGKVVKKQTRPTKIKGHEVVASETEPQFTVESVIVESAKSGKKAAHRAAALKEV